MMFFAHPGYFMNDESMLTGNDPLYHGDLRFRVEDGKSLKDTVDFNSSHLKVYVEVKGYGTTEYGKDGGEPDIRLHNMPCRVFFDNRICPQRRTYILKSGGRAHRTCMWENSVPSGWTGTIRLR